MSIDKNPNQDQQLSKGEIEKLKKAGHNIYDLKGKRNSSKRDLYRDKEGNIYVKTKCGRGDGEETRFNTNDL